MEISGTLALEALPGQMGDYTGGSGFSGGGGYGTFGGGGRGGSGGSDGESGTIYPGGTGSTWKASQWSTLPLSLGQVEIRMGTAEVEEGWLSTGRFRAAVNTGAAPSEVELGVTSMEKASLDVFFLKYKIRIVLTPKAPE